MSVASKKLKTRARIKARIRGKISGTAARPRLTVFRSNKQIYAQVVDDLSGKTLASASSRAIKEAQGVAKIEQAKMVGAKDVFPTPAAVPYRRDQSFQQILFIGVMWCQQRGK